MSKELVESLGLEVGEKVLYMEKIIECVVPKIITLKDIFWILEKKEPFKDMVMYVTCEDFNYPIEFHEIASKKELLQMFDEYELI